MAAIRSVLIANRGEISVRVARTLRAMGIRSVAVYTDADRGSLHRRFADAAVAIGAPGAYLDVEAVIGAAVASGADALHPGYGFLSENPALAEACGPAGIVYIGPPAASIRSMGDKINAKNLASAAGVPVVPGISDAGLDDAGLAEGALGMGLPVLLKPSAGGGGKGMRRVDSEEALPAAIAAARREAIAAFGDGTLLVERFVSRPRHVEIQVLADSHGAVVALGERECSLQRRHQKIVEETPSPLLATETRSAMEDAAAAVAKACGYSGAGTVEFIVSADAPSEFFFMEMNTRLQVEHPVTEMVRGIDLVEWQVRVAAGEALPWREPPSPRGHAVEARIYAEDPANGFLPAAGTIRVLREPEGEGIRVDSCLSTGVEIGVNYDPMLSKVIAWGENRDAALRRLRLALDHTVIAGVRTNVAFLRELLDDPEVQSGDLDTGLVDRVVARLGESHGPAPSTTAAAAALLSEAVELSRNSVGDPWKLLDGWRVGGPVGRAGRWSSDGHEVHVSITGDPLGGASVSIDAGKPLSARVLLGGEGSASIDFDGMSEPYLFAVAGDTVWVCRGSECTELRRVRDSVGESRGRVTAGGAISSPMPGTVLAVHAARGARVHRGDPIVTVEAMKMEHVVAAPSDGTVSKILVTEQQAVALGQPLAELVTGEEP